MHCCLAKNSRQFDTIWRIRSSAFPARYVSSKAVASQGMSKMPVYILSVSVHTMYQFAYLVAVCIISSIVYTECRFAHWVPVCILSARVYTDRPSINKYARPVAAFMRWTVDNCACIQASTNFILSWSASFHSNEVPSLARIYLSTAPKCLSEPW